MRNESSMNHNYIGFFKYTAMILLLFIIKDANSITTYSTMIMEDKVFVASNASFINLHKNIVNGKNVFTQDIITTKNTRYIIQHDYDLQGAEIVIPKGCVLDFRGGSLSNGTIIGNNTKINSGNITIFKKNISLKGTWNHVFTLELFGASKDLKDNKNAIEMINNSNIFKINLIDNYNTSKRLLISCGENQEDISIFSKTKGGLHLYADTFEYKDDLYAIQVVRAKSVSIKGINVSVNVLNKDLVPTNCANSYCVVILPNGVNSTNYYETVGIDIQGCCFTDNVGVPNSPNDKRYFGVVWIGSYTGKCRNIHISDNVFAKPHGRVAYVTECYNVEINNNKFIDVDYLYNYNTLPSNQLMLFRVLSSNNVTIHNNFIHYNSEYSVPGYVAKIFQVSFNDKDYLPSKNVVIEKNQVVIENAAAQVRMFNSEAVHNLNINNNLIEYDVKTSSTDALIQFDNSLPQSDIQKVSFRNNIILNYKNNRIVSTGVRLVIKNNDFYGIKKDSINYVLFFPLYKKEDESKVSIDNNRVFKNGYFHSFMNINH